MSDSLAVVWDEAYLSYELAPDHPLHPVRLGLTMDLARSLGVLDAPNVELAEPFRAPDELLTLVHTGKYLDAVRKAPADPVHAGHGLGPPDTPVFPGMHDAAALLTGGSVRAAELVHTGQVQHAVNIGGGLHHAMPSRAAGFCVYNDSAIAIAWLLRQGVERIAYVDVDVHHGDGVQLAFYDDPRVLTVSLHQHPMTLFPGTGYPTEVGRGSASGTSVNVALPPGTRDAGWLQAFDAVVPSVLRAFRPQLLVTQSGCDSHYEDPLADLELTVDGQRAAYQRLHGLAHELAGGKWVGLGGGGYGVVRCVPRAWTHLLAIAAGRPVDPATALPATFADDVQERGATAMEGGDRPLPTAMTDGGELAYEPWQPATDDPIGRAVTATRKAVFPLHGLDPDDPRD